MASSAAERKQYLVRDGSRLSVEDARIIGPEIDKLMGPDGVRAEDIVDAARPARSKLHPYFQWNDTIAAEAFRREQARYLARSITIHIVRPRQRQPEFRDIILVPSRAFPSVPATQAAGATSRQQNRVYVRHEDVVGDEGRVEMIMGEALKQLLAWQRKYQAYRHVAAFSERFAQVAEAIERLQRAARAPEVVDRHSQAAD